MLGTRKLLAGYVTIRPFTTTIRGSCQESLCCSGTLQPMAGTSTNPYGTQSGFACLWDHMDWVLRVDVALLGIMLVCTLVLIVRVSRSYRLALDRGIDSPAGKAVVAELKAH